MSSLNAEERVVTMKTLIDGINLVQLGFLTNTELFIKEGIFEIKSSADILIDNKHSGGYLSLRQAQGDAYTKTNAQELTIHADNLLKQFEDGNITTALQEYNSIMLQCIECHNKLRNYKNRGHSFN